MSGQLPFWVKGELKILSSTDAYVRIPTGNVYLLRPDTPGIDFSKLKKGQIISCEVTQMLTRVLSAKIISDAAEEDGNPLVS